MYQTTITLSQLINTPEAKELVDEINDHLSKGDL